MFGSSRVTILKRLSKIVNNAQLLHSDPKTKAELLNNQFSSVFTSEDKINMPELGESKNDNIPMLIVHQETTCQHYNNGIRLANDVPPGKCPITHISKKRNPIHTCYKLHGHTLESVPGSKYLVVHVNKYLFWNDHIQQTSAKASRSVGFLRRNLSGCPQDVKAQAYTTLVRPVLEYASTVWDPYTLPQIYALERVQ